MELKIRNGDYVLDTGGGFCALGGTEELAQRALMRLAARRGGFWPLPEYGSRLYTLGRVKPGERAAAARQFVAEALAEETELDVEAVEYLPGQEDRATVEVTLRCGGETAQLRLEV